MTNQGMRKFVEIFTTLVLLHGAGACTDLRSSLGRECAVRRHDVGDVFITCRRWFSQGRVENLWKENWCDEILMALWLFFLLESAFFVLMTSFYFAERRAKTAGISSHFLSRCFPAVHLSDTVGSSPVLMTGTTTAFISRWGRKRTLDLKTRCLCSGTR